MKIKAYLTLNKATKNICGDCDYASFAWSNYFMEYLMIFSLFLFSSCNSFLSCDSESITRAKEMITIFQIDYSSKNTIRKDYNYLKYLNYKAKACHIYNEDEKRILYTLIKNKKEEAIANYNKLSAVNKKPKENL